MKSGEANSDSQDHPVQASEPALSSRLEPTRASADHEFPHACRYLATSPLLDFLHATTSQDEFTEGSNVPRRVVQATKQKGQPAGMIPGLPRMRKSNGSED
nr:hypothetical protein CFP56_64705 [Quercus suber]